LNFTDPSGLTTLGELLTVTAIQGHLRNIQAVRIPATICNAASVANYFEIVSIVRALQSAAGSYGGVSITPQGVAFTLNYEDRKQRLRVGYARDNGQHKATFSFTDKAKDKSSYPYSFDVEINFSDPSSSNFKSAIGGGIPLAEIKACGFTRVALVKVYAEYIGSLSVANGGTLGAKVGFGLEVSFFNGPKSLNQSGLLKFKLPLASIDLDGNITTYFDQF